MNELAYMGVFDKGTITKSIQKLEQMGYVRIEASDLDKRAKLLFSSDKAQELMPQFYRYRSEWNSYLSSDLTVEEIDAYYRAEAKLIAKAREYAKVDVESSDLRLYGLQKLTLLDFPGRMAATVFTGGCNFRCPFCHNRSLVFLNENDGEIDVDDVYDYLSSRSKVLDGVAITGGEPLLHKGIKDFIIKVRSLGLKVKLDTNGTNFEMLKTLIDEKLVDYVAMDIKNAPEKYSKTVGLDSVDLNAIEKSKNYLLQGHVEYEFRTTVVNGFHETDDFKKIGEWIKGAKHYYLQNFEDHGNCIIQGLSEVGIDKLNEFKDAISPYVENVEIRGVED